MGIQCCDHRAASALRSGGGTSARGAGRQARQGLLQPVIHSLSSASNANCSPAACARASEASKGKETPSSADGPATHPGLTARNAAWVDGTRERRFTSSYPARVPGQAANWHRCCWLPGRPSAVGARLTGAGGAPDRNRPRSLGWNLASPTAEDNSRMASPFKMQWSNTLTAELSGKLPKLKSREMRTARDAGLSLKKPLPKLRVRTLPSSISPINLHPSTLPLLRLIGSRLH